MWIVGSVRADECCRGHVGGVSRISVSGVPLVPGVSRVSRVPWLVVVVAAAVVAVVATAVIQDVVRSCVPRVAGRRYPERSQMTIAVELLLKLQAHLCLGSESPASIAEGAGS